MRKWLRSPWVMGIIVMLVGLIVAGYWFQWSWTGFPAKTLWDWLNLLGVLAIPAVVGLGATWYTAQQGKVSDRENTDNQREAALQTYIDRMSELLLVNNLRKSGKIEGEVRDIARVRTLTVLRRLDPERKGSVVQFLSEAGLINTGNRIIYLGKADLRKANLNYAILNHEILGEDGWDIVDVCGADLEGANLVGASFVEAWLYRGSLARADLSGADLSGAHLSRSNLSEAILNKAILRKADLRDVNLTGADLSGADLTGAIGWTDEQLNKAQLRGAIITNGSVHP